MDFDNFIFAIDLFLPLDMIETELLNDFVLRSEIDELYCLNALLNDFKCLCMATIF